MSTEANTGRYWGWQSRPIVRPIVRRPINEIEARARAAESAYPEVTPKGEESLIGGRR